MILQQKQGLCFILCVALAFMLPAWTQPAWAHGMGWQTDGSFAVAVSFRYDDGEPMAFGSVLIYSPATDEYEYQAGRSDENGYFSFRPNAPGIWKFVGDDGQGHVTRGEIHVAPEDLSGAAEARPVARGGAQKPGAFQILLGLSLFANIALASLLYKTKKTAKESR